MVVHQPGDTLTCASNSSSIASQMSDPITDGSTSRASRSAFSSALSDTSTRRTFFRSSKEYPVTKSGLPSG